MNYKTSSLTILFLVLLTAFNIKGQSEAAEDSTKILNVYAGFSVFPNPLYDSVALLECRYSFSRSKVQFYATDSTESSFIAEISGYLDIYDSTGLIYD